MISSDHFIITTCTVLMLFGCGAPRADNSAPTNEEFQTREDCLFATLKQSDASRYPSTIVELTELANNATDQCSASMWHKMDGNSRQVDRLRTQKHALFIAQQFKIERQVRTTGSE